MLRARLRREEGSSHTPAPSRLPACLPACLHYSRTMQTTLDGYPDAIKRLGGKSKIVLLPEAQECNDCEL